MKKLFIVVFLLLLAVCGFARQTSFPDSLHQGRLYTVIGAGTGMYAGGVSYLGFVWYKDHERVPFHFYNDGLGYLQMDKWGHAYSAYHLSQVAYRGLRWAGMDHKRSLLWGGPVGFVFLLPIEIFDGLYEGWGFSWWDAAANGFGSALFSMQQALWQEQIVLMKFSYSPSGYPKYHHILGTTELESFFLDYNGHTYWLSANLRRITGADWIPGWLNLAFGYSGNGMIKEFENPDWYQGQPFPQLERYRQFLFSLDVDFFRIQTGKGWVRSLLHVANMIKVPFPAIEINRIDGVRGRWLYF